MTPTTTKIGGSFYPVENITMRRASACKQCRAPLLPGAPAFAYRHQANGVKVIEYFCPACVPLDWSHFTRIDAEDRTPHHKQLRLDPATLPASAHDMVIMTCNFPRKWLSFIEQVLRAGIDAPSRSELLRVAVREYLDRHYPAWRSGILPDGDGDGQAEFERLVAAELRKSREEGEQ